MLGLEKYAQYEQESVPLFLKTNLDDQVFFATVMEQRGRKGFLPCVPAEILRINQVLFFLVIFLANQILVRRAECTVRSYSTYNVSHYCTQVVLALCEAAAMNGSKLGSKY